MADNAKWYVVHTYSGYENAVKTAIEKFVANRHLDYFHKLKKIFGNCVTIATNNKFVVLKSVKLGRRR